MNKAAKGKKEPPFVTKRPVLRRGKRGPAPDPERADLMPVLYRVKPEHYEALSQAAEERAARRWKDEVEAANREGRSPRPLVKRKDASEVLREVLDTWMEPLQPARSERADIIGRDNARASDRSQRGGR